MSTGKNEAMQLNLSRELYSSTSCHFVGILSPKSKHLLTLPVHQRTGDDFLVLLAEMEDIEFFKIFSNRAKNLLAKSLQFVSRPANEILLKQGETDQPPQALYVILSGVVTEQYNSGLWPEKILRKGEYFGHVDIVHYRPPSVEARSVGYCELLMLAKADFGIVRKQMDTRCNRVGHYLRTVQAIARFEWSGEESKVLEIYSKLCTFTDDQEIYGGTEDNRPLWSYFVVSGVAKVARGLSYHRRESKIPVKFVPSEEVKGDKLVTELVEFEEVKQGYYFGVGESFGGNHVIAGSNLECLLVPRLLLVFKNRELLRAMAKDLTDSLPSDKEVLENHLKLVAASKRKHKILNR